MRPQVTVLTYPVPFGRYFVTETAKSVARTIKAVVSPRPAYYNPQYRGAHPAVVRSMVEGLRKIGVSSNYNPRKLADVGEVVVVPGGFDALRQAIGWKRAGFIRRLLAGTNLADFPSERRDLMCAAEIDLLIVPGPWFRDNFVADCRELEGRVVPWPAGVDVDYWCPATPSNGSRQVLIYEKENKGLPRPVSDYVPIVERHSYAVDHIAWGKYMPDEYLRALRQSHVMVGFSTDESQGIAWAEAWSVNVPTLLWNQDCVTYKGRTYRTSSAPYLSPQTGLFFRSLAEFESVFRHWQGSRGQFRPRQWVLENMSDEVCARKLCDLAHVLP